MRRVLRVAGSLTIELELLLTAVGIGSFFSSFGNFERPRYFWCAFLGMPLPGVGGMMCVFGYIGTLARRQAAKWLLLAKMHSITRPIRLSMASGSWHLRPPQGFAEEQREKRPLYEVRQRWRPRCPLLRRMRRVPAAGVPRLWHG